MSYHSHLFTAHRHVNIICRLRRSLFLPPRSIKICHIHSYVLFMLHNISICYNGLEGHMIKYSILFAFLKIILTFPLYQKCERSSRIWEITVFYVVLCLNYSVFCCTVSKLEMRQKICCEFPNFCPSPSQTVVQTRS